MFFVAIIGAIAFATLLGLIFVSAESYTTFEQTIMEFIFVGRLPGTDVYFDFDAFILSVTLLALAGFLTSVLFRTVNRRLVGEYAERVGI